MTGELNNFFTVWVNAVCGIRAENKDNENNVDIKEEENDNN